jgi:hypothetical protein
VRPDAADAVVAAGGRLDDLLAQLEVIRSHKGGKFSGT